MVVAFCHIVTETDKKNVIRPEKQAVCQTMSRKGIIMKRDSMKKRTDTIQWQSYQP